MMRDPCSSHVCRSLSWGGSRMQSLYPNPTDPPISNDAYEPTNNSAHPHTRGVCLRHPRRPPLQQPPEPPPPLPPKGTPPPPGPPNQTCTHPHPPPRHPSGLSTMGFRTHCFSLRISMLDYSDMNKPLAVTAPPQAYFSARSLWVHRRLYVEAALLWCLSHFSQYSAFR